MSDSLQLFKTKRFLPLFVTQFFGAFNDNVFKNAFLIWFTYDVAEKTGANAAMMVTIAAGLFILPFFLFSATAGQCADKYEKGWLSQKIKQVEILLMMGCAICFYVENIYGLLFILFMMGVQSTFFGPIKYSLLPEHLKESELIAGNGLIEGGTFLSILLGTIFGGLIIRSEYGVELLSFFVILFAVIGWLGSRKIPVSAIGDPALKVSWNMIAETMKIIGYAKKERTVWLSIIGISWFWLVGVTFQTQFPAYTKAVIGGDEYIVTLFLTLFSLGIGVGSLWCNTLLNGEINGKWVPAGCLGISVSVALFSVASYCYVAPHNGLVGLSDFLTSGVAAWGIMLSLLMLAISAGVYIVPLYAIMQHRSESAYLSRIIASNNVLNAFFMASGSIVAVVLFAIGVDVLQLLMVVGIINIVAFFIVRKIVKRRLSHA